MASRSERLIVFSNLDGSLLDTNTYSFDGAQPALDALNSAQIPLILVSSRTRSEIEPLRFRLKNEHPFIIENGSAVFIPKGYFPFPLEWATVRGSYQVIELGTSYTTLRGILKEIAQQVPSVIRGFGDLSAGDIASLTGLSPSEAMLAKQREYDEPFWVEGTQDSFQEVSRLIHARGQRCTQGRQFCHLTGQTDKGEACNRLVQAFHRQGAEAGDRLVTIGVGNSPADLPFLARMDKSILLPKPDGTYGINIPLSNMSRAPHSGPVGWNDAILQLFEIRS